MTRAEQTCRCCRAPVRRIPTNIKPINELSYKFAYYFKCLGCGNCYFDDSPGHGLEEDQVPGASAHVVKEAPEPMTF